MSIRHNNKTIAGGYSPTSYRYVGEIFQSALPITDPKVHALDGSKITITEGYAQFIQHLNNLVLTYPQLACTEEEWQAIKTASKLGQCGKFVIDDEAGTIRLPAIININGLTDLSKAGLIKDESLPNITGGFNAYSYDLGQNYGVFSSSIPSANVLMNGSATNYNYNNFNIDASRSSSTYQDGAPVQQEAIQYPYYIVLATGVVQNITYYEDLKVNNTNVYGDSKYIKGEVNNLSWLKSEGQWNDGETYKGLYEWAVNQMNNNVEGFKGPTGYCYKDNTQDYHVWFNSVSPKVGDIAYGYHTCIRLGNVTAVDTTNNTITVYEISEQKSYTVSRDVTNDITETKNYATYIKWIQPTNWLIDTQNKRFKLPSSSGKRVLVECMHYDQFGWNIFNDGWYEYWNLGDIPKLAANSTKLVTVSLVRRMKDKNYNVTVTVQDDPGNSWLLNVYGIIKNTETISVGWAAREALVHEGKFMYKVTGYLADGCYQQLPLYYYTGESIKNSDLVNISKIQNNITTKLETDLSNIPTSSKETITHWGFPSNKYINLTLNASGSSYTAPADGYVTVSLVFNNTDLGTRYCRLRGTKSLLDTFSIQNNINNGQVGCYLPVKKGETYLCIYGVGTITQYEFNFVYAVGSEPTA